MENHALATVEKALKRKKPHHAAEIDGNGWLAYESEKPWRQSMADAEALDELLRVGADASRIDRLILSAEGRLPATLARTTRLFDLFAPHRLLALSEAARHALVMTYSHVNTRYASVACMCPDELAQLAATFSLMRQMLKNGSAHELALVRQTIKAKGFPVTVFLDEATALDCLERLPEALEGAASANRELVATLLLADSVSSSARGALFRIVHEDLLRVHSPCCAHKCGIRLLGHEAGAPDRICGLSFPCRIDDDPARADYALAVNGNLQKAYADSDFVRRTLVDNRLPGHENVAASFRTLHHAENSRTCTSRTARIADLANDGNPAYFKLMLDLEGLAVDSERVVIELIRRGHVRSLAYIVGNAFESLKKGCMTPAQLLFHSSTIRDWRAAAELAEAVETAAPGTAANATDVFGNTPVWYTLYNDHRDDAQGLAKYVKTLCGLGCDKMRRNHLRLAYGEMWWNNTSRGCGFT